MRRSINIKKKLIPLLAAAALLTGCAKPKSFTPSAAEELFDYSINGMRWDDIIEFEMDEFPDVKFEWDSLNLTANENGTKRTLYSGMPIWSVCFCDLNEDGKREIVSGISLGSGIIDDRIIVYDYANSKLYSLSDRMKFDFTPIVDENNTLCISKRAYGEYPDEHGEPTVEPLTLDKLTEIDKIDL